MVVNRILKIEFIRKLLYRIGERRAAHLLGTFEQYMPTGSSVLDIGAGICNIAYQLEKRGYPTTALDIQDLSVVSGYKAQLYDGETIPYADNSFDYGLLITVLHHVPKQLKLLDETVRVARNVIIIEDVYTTKPHRYVTYLIDSLLNLEFFGHPHGNRDDSGWKEVFESKNLEIMKEYDFTSYGIIKHKLYVLKSV
jgi:ubiquinone/menaquinone biosynthesis C-methylase UbiE